MGGAGFCLGNGGLAGRDREAVEDGDEEQVAGAVGPEKLDVVVVGVEVDGEEVAVREADVVVIDGPEARLHLEGVDVEERPGVVLHLEGAAERGAVSPPSAAGEGQSESEQGRERDHGQ